MNNQDFERPSLWRENTPPPKQESPSILPILIGGGLVVGLLLVVVGGLIARASPHHYQFQQQWRLRRPKRRLWRHRQLYLRLQRLTAHRRQPISRLSPTRRNRTSGIRQRRTPP